MTTFIERCETLLPLLAEDAADAEQQRRVTDRVMAAAHEIDLFRGVTPTSVGGHGEGFNELLQGTRILGQGCVSSAWTLSFLTMHGWLLSKFPEAGRDDFFSAPSAPLAPAPLSPTGRATPVEGGYRISGKWEWATGINHSDWVLVHAVQSEPTFAMRIAALPIEDVIVDDVWFTAGMAATGSNTVRVDDVFVPEHRVIDSFSFLDSSIAADGDGLRYLPVMPVLSLMAAAPALGGAETAVALFEERLRTRILAYTLGDKATEQPAAQIRLSAARAELQATRDYFDATIARLVDARDAGDISDLARTDARLAAARVVQGARSVVNTIVEGAGASVYFSSHPLQRIQRDLETLKGHFVFDWDRTAELAGRIALGGALGPTDMT